MPAQQMIPLLLRWMLLLEDSDEDRLYVAKGVPREWVAWGAPMSLQQAPTRWGRINLTLAARPTTNSIVVSLELARPRAAKEVQIKLRLPKQSPLRSVTVNGRAVAMAGGHHDTVVVATAGEKNFEVIGQWG
jgi:hypothetical protein